MNEMELINAVNGAKKLQ